MEPIVMGVYIVLAISLVIPVLSIITSRASKLIPGLTWLSVLIFAAVSLGTYVKSPLSLYGGLVRHDHFTSILLMAISLAAAISILASGREPAFWESSPAYYSLLPLALFGSFYMVGAMDALLVLSTWLLVSVISYVLMALPSDRGSRGAAIQYIFLGAIATLFLAIWVGGDYVLSSQAGNLGFPLAGLTIDKFSALVLLSLIVALGFKVGIVPFHWWLPSVYSKGNGYMVGVVAGMIKIAFLGLITRIILYSSSDPIVASRVAIVLAVLSVATMTYGNIAALTTKDIRKLLAYSSIAQVGYVLVGLSALAYLAPKDTGMTTIALAAIAIQATAYGLSKAALFPIGVDESRIEKLRGLLSGNRLVSASAGMLLLSLLGLPPLLGFWGKLYLFYAASAYTIILVAIALVNSAISSAYYVRALRDLVASEKPQVSLKWHIGAAIIISAIAILVLGIIAPLYVASLT